MQKNVPHDLLTYLILEKMGKGPSYGYAIIKMLEEMSGGNWKISYGTLYGALDRMKKKGFITPVEGDRSDRKYFELTDEGRTYMMSRKEEMKNMGMRSRETIIGFLHVYEQVHGKERFKELLDSIDREFR
ncbi:MAG: PadR family transcriptional regulator [Thermoplasmata archaeon]|nr:PadR family transcriptional regulator [Thermoplasmata archaeon]